MNVIHRNHTKKKLFVLLILAFGLLLIAIFADYLCPYDPYEQNLNLAKQPPSASHLLGTDMLGRDLLSRIIIGSCPSADWDCFRFWDLFWYFMRLAGRPF